MSRAVQLISDRRKSDSSTLGSLARLMPLRLIGACILGLSAAPVSGCSTATSKLEARYKVGVPVSRVYYAKYEEVEAGIKQAMIKYPQRVDNTEAGIFETDYVKGNARFVPAHSTEELSSGYRYRIIIRLVRGRSETRPAVRVSVLKNIELVRDFFAEPEQLPSDGLEENAILYRVGREISIAKAIVRATEKSNAKSQPPQ